MKPVFAFLCAASLTAASALLAAETIVYKKAGGRELRLFVDKPADWKATDARPAIVFFFGGGWVGGKPEQFLPQSEYFASRGLVGIRVEYRTIPKGGSGPPTICCEDAKSAMRYVRARAMELGIDPGRIAASGGSAGGHLAAVTALIPGLDDPADDVKVSCRPQALVLFNPVFNNGPGQWGYERVGERYREFSPAHNITPGAPPAIVFLGDSDKLVPVSVLKEFAEEMKKVGSRCDSHVYPGVGHGFFNQDPYLTLTLIAADKFIASLGWLQGPPTLEPPSSLLSPEDTAFLHDQAARIVRLARVAPGEKSGNTTNLTPYAMHLPDGHRVYRAFWVRDSAMALGADFVAAEDVRDGIQLTAATVSNQDWQVRPGVLVPAYSVPDHINFDGKPTFFPGNYEEGVKQGGGNWGTVPPLDDAFFFLFAVEEQAALTKSFILFKSAVSTATGPMNLSDLCLKIFDAIPVDAATGIPSTGAPHQPNASGKDFGFCDTVQKSGKLLFTAVLKYDAAHRLAPLYQKIGQAGAAAHLLQAADSIKKNLGATFYRESSHPGEGWLDSATDVGRQPDVWGSAYAVAAGAVDRKTAHQVALALLRGYRDGSLVNAGCVSEVLQQDPANPQGWQNTTRPFGDYQNGGYWPTAAGWYILALNTIDPKAARTMAKDYVEFMRANRREDGTAQAWEWFNPNLKKYAHPQYVASAAFPYCVLNRAGLLIHNPGD